jgi:predicted component of type VI protein secretion system
MKLSLVVLSQGNKMEGKALEIKLAQFLVGRDPQCHLRPASSLISKRHCALLQRDGKAFVRDFESTNGTFVNDQPVKGEVELHHEDQLKIGPLLFSVRIEATPPVSRPTPAPPTKSPTKKPAKAASATPPPDSSGAAKPAGPAAAPADKPSEKPAEPAPEPVASSGSDEDIAAMLLALQDDGSGTSGLSAEVPDGSTVHDLTVSPEMLAGQDGQAAKPGDKAAAKDKAMNTANTSAAAKSILEKYMRRPRGQQPS